ncbi:MAG: hypothetical protein AB7G11_11100 [Phycisphaerales bacterium]
MTAATTLLETLPGGMPRGTPDAVLHAYLDARDRYQRTRCPIWRAVCAELERQVGWLAEGWDTTHVVVEWRERRHVVVIRAGDLEAREPLVEVFEAFEPAELEWMDRRAC